MENKGQYVDAETFNRLTADPDTLVVDMRNHYEYEVGHFEKAVEIPSDTFREQLPRAAEMLGDRKDKPVIMYCTGGLAAKKPVLISYIAGLKKCSTWKAELSTMQIQ
jgi:UPF0176 protein